MSISLMVQNNGQEIVATNFWETEHARRGLFYLSINAGAFRLLVPEAHTSAISEFKTAKDVILSRGPWSQMGNRDAIEILFDDESESPYALHLDARQLDRLPAREDAGRTAVFTAWLRGAQGAPVCAYRHECYYRVVPRIPWLKGRSE